MIQSLQYVTHYKPTGNSAFTETHSFSRGNFFLLKNISQKPQCLLPTVNLSTDLLKHIYQLMLNIFYIHLHKYMTKRYI